MGRVGYGVGVEGGLSLNPCAVTLANLAFQIYKRNVRKVNVKYGFASRRSYCSTCSCLVSAGFRQQIQNYH